VEDRHAFPFIGRCQPSKKEKNEKSIVKRMLKQIKIPLLQCQINFDHCHQSFKARTKLSKNSRINFAQKKEIWFLTVSAFRFALLFLE
jgi:hypothetical protein